MIESSRISFSSHRRSLSFGVSSLSASLLLSVLGCSSRDLPLQNLGNTGELPSPVTPQSNSSSAATGKASYNGHWVGETLDPLIRDENGRPSNYVFPSGSNQIAVDLTFDGDVLSDASIVFGEGTVPEPETGVAYPPGVSYTPSIGQVLPPLEGFSYRLVEAAPLYGEPLVTVAYDSLGAFEEWCPLQPALPVGDGSYSCLGIGGYGFSLTESGDRVCTGSFPDGHQEGVDCGMTALCVGQSVCVCDANGCTSGNTAFNTVMLEADGDDLVATFISVYVENGSSGGQLGPVRLRRQP